MNVWWSAVWINFMNKLSAKLLEVKYMGVRKK